MAKSKSEKRGIYLYIDGKEVVNDINHIEKECRQLTQQLKTMTIGSEEYNRTMAKIKHLQGILKQHRQEIKGITSETQKATLSVGKMVDWFNRFGGIILSVVGLLTGVSLALRSIRNERNKLEESQAGLKALTGLDDENISWLTEQAKTLSTTMTKEGLRVRQSAAEILDAFMLVGSAKPELLGDKEALKQVTEEAMRLQAAAKDITLNEAVDSLTLSLNQYGAAADQAGKFANVLAAGSQAGSANIASQAKAIRNAGTAAASANVPIEQTVGLIETLAYRGIKDEVAGTGLKKFFLVLQTGADETNPKIVGLDKALENLKNKKMDAGAIKKMFGEEGYNTASVILQNTEMVKDYTKAVTDTNVAYEQSAINSNTAQAKLEQARNKMKQAAIELGEKLNPALAVSTNMMTKLIKILPGLIEWLQKWGASIIALLIPVVAYIGCLKMWALYQTALNKVTTIATTLKIAYAAATANVAGNLTGANKILVLFSGNMSKSIALQKTATAVAYLFAAAKAVLTGNLKAARVAMLAFNATVSTNFYVAIAAAIAAVAVAIYKVAMQTTEAEKAVSDYQKQLVTERSELNKLIDAAQRAGDGTKRRRELIDEINMKYGKYLTNLLNEYSTLEDIKQAYQEINIAMQANIAQKVLDEKTEEISRDMLDKKIDKMNKVRSTLSNLFPSNLTNDITQKIEKAVNLAINKGQTAQQISIALAQKIRQLYGGNKDFEDNLRKGITAYADTVIKEVARINKVKEELAVFVPGVGQTNKLPEVVVTGIAPKKNDTNGNGDIEKESEKKKRVNKELENIEIRHGERIASIKKEYLNDERMTQSEYDKKMLDAEIKCLNEKLAVIGIEESKRQQIENRILDIRLKLSQKLREIFADTDEFAKKAYDKEVQALKEKETEEIETLKFGLEQKLINEVEYQQRLLEIQNKYAKKREKLLRVDKKEIKDKYDQKLSDTLLNAYKAKKGNPLDQKSFFREMMTSLSAAEAELAKMDEKDPEYSSMCKYVDGLQKALKEKLEALKLMLEDISIELGTAMGELLTGDQEGMRDALRNTLNMFLDFIEKEMIAAVGSVTIAEFILNPLGIFASIGKILAIKAAFAGIKSAIGNFYAGGYTGPGNWDQPQGIVHSNEFVANRFAVGNPNLRPIFDVIDVAQRSGNVGNLTADDIAAVAGSGKVMHNVPVKTGNVNATTTTNDPAMMAVLIECIHVLRKLKVRLDDPLLAETYITGKGGINRAQKEYDKLIKNVSR
ncbi:phage tail tape measure protein [Bacteroides helcogenes]|uniref:Phage tail tape measure protein, TP901 family n=1 Tax=Bacteroides helcogenes (strain ATCC 35417 / DSM 20613 / JCM 6297 / CCUG 15421 / P 36-108) TaxID=693979 RepID=E6SUP2_BACT6|nr:phage tail tape measure protein [Bacteroides helcogenes]ADV44387.1 phage tail tape measure protein, TP901 family [Bacteroides helcogenes P 36-108]